MTEQIDLKLALEAQLEGKQTFSETDAGIRTMRDAVKKFAEMQAAGMPIAEAYKEAIDGFRDHALEGGLAIGRMTDAVKDATSAIDRFRLAEAAGLPFDAALTASTEANVAAMEEKAAVDAEEAGLMDLLAAANWQGALAILAVAAAVGAAVAVLAPFVAITVGAIVVVTTWLVAISGVVLLIAALTAGVLGLGIGMLVLVDTAKLIEPRFLILDAHLQAMHKTLATLAIPAVKQLLDFFDQLIPSLTNVATALIQWFSGELPSILSGIGKVLKDLAPDFNAFGGFLANLFNQSKGLNIGTLIEEGVRAAIGAVEGLLSNLFRITKWFEDNPQVIAVASSIFSWFGNVIQWIAKTWAGWAEWVATNWPIIMGFAKVALQQFGDTWNTSVAPLLNQFVQTIGPWVVAMLAYIALHWDAIARILGFVVIAIIGVTLVLLAMGVAFVAVVDWAFAAGQAITDAFEAAKNNVINMINKIIEAANHIPGVNIALVGYGGGASAPPTSTGAHSRRGGNVGLAEGGAIGTEGAWVGEEGRAEFFIPDSPGRILPQSSSGGMDTAKIEYYLKLIEAHLAFMKQEAPAISATAMVRRSA